MEPHSISSDEELIRKLTYEWAKAELPDQGFTYGQYVKVVRKLLLSVKNPDRAESIFTAVLTQAVSLQKTSAWVELEIQFEKMAESIGRRADLLLVELQHSSLVDDAALDLYNERVRRFSNDQKTA